MPIKLIDYDAIINTNRINIGILLYYFFHSLNCLYINKIGPSFIDN